MLQFSTTNRLQGLGDAKADAITLQIAANRYASTVGKTPLVTDGVIGSLTLSMVRAALQYLVNTNVNAATAAGLLAKVTTTAAVATSAVGLSTFLNDSMDTIKLKAIQNAQTRQFLTMDFVPMTTVKPVPQPGAQPTSPDQVPTPQQPIVQAGLPITLPMATSIVGLSPAAKQTLLIIGGVVLGVFLLKRLL